VFVNDSRSHYGDTLAVTNERNTDVENMRNNADGGKEGLGPEAALSTRKPPWAATASNSTKCEAEVLDIREEGDRSSTVWT
jgi:hypothetical protein